MSDATSRTPDDIRADIETTREELAETAAALAERADVKARAQEKVEETKARFTHKVDEAKSKVTGTAEAAKEKATGAAGTVKDKASEATPSSVSSGASQAAGGLMERVKADPLPFALVAGFAGGALVGWLMARR